MTTDKATDASSFHAAHQTRSLKATESRAPLPPSLSSQELLKEMVASTQRLDGILHGLCASSQQRPQHDEGESSAASDPIGLDSDHSRAGRAESFEILAALLQASAGNQRCVTVDLDDALLDDQLIDDDEDQPADPSWWRRFTQRTSLFLPSRAISAASSSTSLPIGYTTERLPLGVSLALVERRLRQELAACDHLLPDTTAKTLANRALQHLQAYSNLLQRGISSAVGLVCKAGGGDDEDRQENQTPSSPWWTESDRQCQVSIDEGEYDGAWGLRLVLDVHSRLESASMNGKLSETVSLEPETNPPQVVAAKLWHLVFVPKRDYDIDTHNKADGGLMASSCLLELSLITSETETTTDPSTAMSNEPGADEDRQQDHAIAASPAPPSPLNASTMLPDALDVFVSGVHGPSTNVKEDEDSGAAYWSPTSAFASLDIPSTLPRRNRIVQAACGRLHSLFVNDLGMVFACGHATHGALGISDAASFPLSPSDYVATPTLVEFFLEKLLVVRQVACGGDMLTGAHSAAVTSNGELFTWGAGVALGSRSLRNASEPQRVRFPVDDSSDGDGSSNEMRIKSVACGCGFAVAIVRDDGAAYAWGKWSEGRLGLGRIPVIERISRRHGGRKQLQAFQLSPRRLTLPVQSDTSEPASISTDAKPPAFIKVACGDAHCIAITMDGRLVSWGRGGSGQLGIGALGDALSPVAVVVTGDSSLGSDTGSRWRDIAAGSDWSMALDDNGRVWSWGAYGSGALGLGAANAVDSTRRALVTRALMARHEELVNRQRHRETEAEGRSKWAEANASDLMPRLSWMMPQLVPAFADGDIEIVTISAGARHGAALSRSGALFTWGDDYDTDKHVGSVDSGTPHLVDLGVRDTDAITDAKASPIVVETVVCGGQQVVALASSGGSLARDLHLLFQFCMQLSERGEATANDLNDWARPDVALLVSGRRLLAHKFLLARRFPVLRRLLLDQLAAFDTSSASSFGRTVPEVLVPSLRLDVARVVLEFIYTDSVALPSQLLSMQQEEQQGFQNSASVAIYLARDVLRAAIEFELPGLARICRERLIPAFSSVPAPQGAQDGGGGDDEEVLTLSRSLDAAYGDSTWSDVTLIADGREIPAHRCVLIARSEFFRRLLGRGRQTTSVVVEDSFEGLIRVLDFIYSDRVAMPSSFSSSSPSKTANFDKSDENRPAVETSQEQQDGADRALKLVLEDLQAAHRYGLEHMKRACERLITVTTGNCWEVLDAAERAHASQLKLAALAFAQRHLPHVVLGSSTAVDSDDTTLGESAASRFERFRRAHPRLVDELFARLRTAEREDRLMTDWKASVEARVQAEQREEERAWQERRADARFPWLSLTLAVTFGALFLALMNSHEFRFHPAVPALNLAALALLAAAAIFGWLERI